jgi:hypothetical protein
MNPEIKKMWADALRSGKYVQGTRYLKYEASGKVCHCALGVLCDLAVKSGAAEWVVSGHDIHPSAGNIIIVSHCDIGETALPRSVAEWAGLAGISCYDPDLWDEGHVRKLLVSEWNDVRGATFHQIAEMIEEQL